MNEKNEWDHRISGEGPADCIRINEVATALKTRNLCYRKDDRMMRLI